MLISIRHLNQAKYVEFMENMIADSLQGVLRISEADKRVISAPYSSLQVEYQAEVRYPSKVPLVKCFKRF